MKRCNYGKIPLKIVAGNERLPASGKSTAPIIRDRFPQQAKIAILRSPRNDARPIDDRGRNPKVVDWLDELTADCSKKTAHNTSIAANAMSALGHSWFVYSMISSARCWR
jgi:hypothetical protein